MSHTGSDRTLSQTCTSSVPVGTDLFRQVREAKGYSREDLAVTCGLTVDEIEDLELGNDVSPAHLRRVAAALGLPSE